MSKLLNYTKQITQNTILESKIGYFAIYKLLSHLKNLQKNVDAYNTIYIDISVYAKSDNKTGIQRVIREVIYQILLDTTFYPKIKFVIATQKIGYRVVNYHIEDGLPSFDIASALHFIHPTRNDLFLGLDFCPNVITFHLVNFIQWKLKGVAFVWLLYDLLPITNPEWFTPNILKNFAPWLKSIYLLSDNILCISATVKNEAKNFSDILQIQPKLSIIRLGQGFNIKPDTQTNLQFYTLEDKYLAPDQVLMIGTLEPRKGHLSIIQAFTKLWQLNQTNYRLILIGKQGWLVEELISQIENNQFYNEKLIWLNDVDDATLKKLYQSSKGVIVASLNEGYGLPLLEALGFNKPVFARDIPIFQEVADAHPNVTYFSSNDYKIEKSLEYWLSTLANHEFINAFTYASWHNTWEDIKSQLIKRL